MMPWITMVGTAPWSSDRTWAIVLGILAAIVSLALVIVSWTRWGQTKSLTKCVVLAVLAHVWLLMYAYGTRVIMPGDGNGGHGGVAVQVDFASVQEGDETPLGDEAKPKDEENAAERLLSLLGDGGKTQTLEAPELLTPIETPELTKTEPSPSIVPIDSSEVPEVPKGPEGPLIVEDRREGSVLPSIESISAPTIDTPSVLPDTQAIPSSLPPLASPAPSMVLRELRQADQKALPEPYMNRLSNRANAAMAFGGDANTEAAVEAALDWLAKHQSVDGAWNAAVHGAGRETRTLGVDRGKAGAKADTGMTGLALLAFQGAGYTHLQGKYSEQVLAGISYLVSQQMPSGDLAGSKQIGAEPGIQYARMYCHGIAALALAEAYAMTGDTRLEDPVARAIQYTLRCQNPRTGGWRYLARDLDDPGDMSQFGWQAMALQSARTGGIATPRDIDRRFATFLELVATGTHLGLATYRPKTILEKSTRPGEGPIPQRPSAAMTAEAMACRLLLKVPMSAEAEQEARQMLLANLPGQGEENLYYWYYGTLAMFQSQSSDWNVWNDAMKRVLVATQRLDQGDDFGSWNPTCIWGGYGGRVYSTSVACMCLEVYYRYLPIYRNPATAQRGPVNSFSPMQR